MLVVLLLAIFSYTVQAGENFYCYEYTKAEERWEIGFIMTKRDDRIEIKICDEIKDEVFYYDNTFSTMLHHIVNEKEKTNLRKTRNNNQIIIEGVVKGEVIQKIIKIDERPWYQNFEICLAEFARSDLLKKEFWVINEEDFSAYTMTARKKGVENIEIHGQAIEAQKVELRLSGFLSMFWKAECWYRCSDGIFLKYRGTSGPGTPEMTIVLRKERVGGAL